MVGRAIVRPSIAIVDPKQIEGGAFTFFIGSFPTRFGCLLALARPVTPRLPLGALRSPPSGEGVLPRRVIPVLERPALAAAHLRMNTVGKVLFGGTSKTLPLPSGATTPIGYGERAKVLTVTSGARTASAPA